MMTVNVEPIARLNHAGALTVNHITAGRVLSVERTLCGLRIPDGAQPADNKAPWCLTCRHLDA
jgi:hypothetical protein